MHLLYTMLGEPSEPLSRRRGYNCVHICACVRFRKLFRIKEHIVNFAIAKKLQIDAFLNHADIFNIP